MENRAKTTARKMVKALGEFMFRPKSDGWWHGHRAVEAEDGRPREEGVVHGGGEGHGGQGQVEAAEAQGGQRHERARRRRPGRPPPRGPAASRRCPNLYMAKAPRPAKVSWQIDTYPPQPVSGTSDRQTSPKARPMPSLMMLPGPMNETATQTAATRRTPPWRERTKLAGASGAWRWGVPLRIRCAGSSEQDDEEDDRGHRLGAGPGSASRPRSRRCRDVAQGVGRGEADDERRRRRSWAGCAGARSWPRRRRR